MKANTKSNRQVFSLTVLFACIVSPNSAFAYIVRGAGLSVIGSAVAVIGAFFLMIVGFIWYPIRRFLRREQYNEHKSEKIQQT